MSTKGLMTSSELIEAVKRRAFLPNTQQALDDQDILRFLNEELNDSVIPLILQMHEEYFLYSITVPLEAGKQHYKIPYRAIGRRLRDVKYEDLNQNVFDMARIDPADRNFFQKNSFNSYRTFYVQGDEIVLTNQVGASPVGNLNFLYYQKPNELVKEDRVSTIQSINTSTGEIIVDSIPSNITINSKIDFLECKAGNRTLKFDIVVQNIDTNTNKLTFSTTDLPEDLSVEDFIATAGECIIPQIPAEMHSILAEKVAARCLASLGDAQGVQLSNAKIAEMESKVASLIDNRTEGNPQKINNLNSILRRSKLARRRYIY